MRIPNINTFIIEHEILESDEGYAGFIKYGDKFELVDVSTRRSFFSIKMTSRSQIRDLKMDDWCELVEPILINICLRRDVYSTPMPLYFKEEILPHLLKEIRARNLDILLPDTTK